MTAWTDATSYSQGDRLRGRQPDAWRVSNGRVRIWISKSHPYYPGEWVVTCHALLIETVRLDLTADADLPTAQAAAINLVRDEALKLVATVEAFAKESQP